MKARDLLRRLWRWSPLVTLPVTLVWIYWILQVAGRFEDFGLRYGTLQDNADLRKLGQMEFDHLLRRAELGLSPSRTRSTGGLRQVELYVSRQDQARLDDNLPHSGRNYVDGYLGYPSGDIHPVEVRYRGDFYWHWSMYKKSLRVKTKKKHLYEHVRSINLINPKFPWKHSGALAYDLGGRMGLIVPQSELVGVTINGKYSGMYLMVEQLEEMVLRNCGRMPGDLFAGEVTRREAYRGITRSVFEHPGLWEKVAINNHYPDESRVSIERLSALVTAEPSEAVADELIGLVNLEAFGTFAAYRSLVQSDHYDDGHNWRLYYDPWRNAFEPVVWDPDSWHPNWAPKSGASARPHIANSTLDLALMRDQRFLRARHRAIVRFFEEGQDRQLLERIDAERDRALVAIQLDPTLVRHFKYATVGEVEAEMDRFRGIVSGILDDIYNAYLRDSGPLRYAIDESQPGLIALEMDGLRPLESIGVEFLMPPTVAPEVTLSYWNEAGRQDVDVSGAVVVESKRLLINHMFMARLIGNFNPKAKGGRRQQYYTLPAYYELKLHGLPAEASMVDVHADLGGGERLGGVRVESLEPTAFEQTFGIVTEMPRQGPLVWSGTRRVEGVQTIRRDLILEPGTTLLMAPDASLIVEGRVSAIGEEQDPIQVIPQSADQEPWGVFAIRTPRANHSEFAHCVIRGGSGLKHPLYEYSGMFSVHDVPHVTVRNSHFSDSRVVDDMVHVVYADVLLKNCEFKSSLLDAVDLDNCTAVVEGCRFTSSGNDALDLMASNVVVKDCLIARSGDKGVSVGEGTNAMIMNTLLQFCEIGVQVKDGSNAAVLNVDFTKNKMALDAYKKNWRYDSGGFAWIHNSRLMNNDSLLTADSHSRIAIRDSYADTEIEPGKRIAVDETVDSKRLRRSRLPKVRASAVGEMADIELFKPYWALAVPSTRGAKRTP